ncbi:hypothetical protein [Clostridium thailandense]|uniref:hypothetical protein n=1 Tax=Clostridium thailandense TaxID=2794346 RepID=UPI00398934DC
MSLYCLKCKKWAYKTHKCNINSLISITKNILPTVLKVDSLGLQVASAFCLAETHKTPYKHTLIEAGVYFKCLYPEMLLQDLPSGWYWTDYITLEHKAICSSIVYNAEYVDTGAMSLDKTVEGVINDLLDYLDTKDKNGLRAIMLLSDS